MRATSSLHHRTLSHSAASPAWPTATAHCRLLVAAAGSPLQCCPNCLPPRHGSGQMQLESTALRLPFKSRGGWQQGDHKPSPRGPSRASPFPGHYIQQESTKTGASPARAPAHALARAAAPALAPAPEQLQACLVPPRALPAAPQGWSRPGAPLCCLSGGNCGSGGGKAQSAVCRAGKRKSQVLLFAAFSQTRKRSLPDWHGRGKPTLQPPNP